MAKKATITIRIDEDLKKKAQEIFDDLGLDMTTAVTMFLKQVNSHQGLPFEVRRTAIQEALAEVERGEVTSFDSVEEFSKWLKEV